MNKFLATAFALGAGLAVSVTGANTADAASFGNTSAAAAGLTLSTKAPVVDVHYRKGRYSKRSRFSRRANWRRRAHIRRCASLRRKANRWGSRKAWRQYRAVCR